MGNTKENISWKNADFASKILGKRIEEKKDLDGLSHVCVIKKVRIMKDGSVKILVGSKQTSQFDHVIHILDKYCFHYSDTKMQGTELFPVDVIFRYGRIINSTSLADFRKGIVNFNDDLQLTWLNILKNAGELVPREYEASKQEEYTRYFASLTKTKEGKFALDALRKVLADPRLAQSEKESGKVK